MVPLRACIRTTLIVLLAIGGPVLAGCSTSPEKQIQEDIRDTTIIPNLGNYDEVVQRESVQRMLVLLEKAPDVAANLLVTSMRDPVYDERTKMVCAWLLSTVEDDRALPTLMEYLGQGTNSSESLVREAVVSYGGKVVPAVVEVMEDGNDLARIAAAEVLIELDTSEGRDALAARLTREPESRVRFLILCGVTADPRENATRTLERALSDRDAMNRELAWDSLSRRLRIPPSIAFDPHAPDEIREKQRTTFEEWRESLRP